jgi:hypothetical protein
MATVEIGGELWDDQTGEYLGPVSNWIEGPVDSLDVAMQVMRRHLELEAAHAAKTAELESVLEHVRRLSRESAARLEWFKRRYQEEIAGFALTQLPRDRAGNLKSKTWRTPYGTVSFRSSAPKIEVQDEEEALRWAERHCPGAVKVKRSILVSQIPEDVKTAMIEKPEDAEFIGFGIVGGEETVRIKSLVEESK